MGERLCDLFAHGLLMHRNGCGTVICRALVDRECAGSIRFIATPQRTAERRRSAGALCTELLSLQAIKAMGAQGVVQWQIRVLERMRIALHAQSAHDRLRR